MDYIKVSDASRQLGVTVQTIYSYCKSGTLPCVQFKVGNRITWKIKKSEFEKLLLDGKL
jgi:excisionase family DNA binding protein